MPCAGTLSAENCGGIYTLTAYEIDHNITVPGYLGCYADGPMRAMNAEGKYVDVAMTCI